MVDNLTHPYTFLTAGKTQKMTNTQPLKDTECSKPSNHIFPSLGISKLYISENCTNDIIANLSVLAIAVLLSHPSFSLIPSQTSNQQKR